MTGPEGGIDGRERILVGAFSCAPVAVPSHEVVVLPRDVEVVAPHLVADLYDPSLVITPGYVGPDRRRTDRSVSPRVRVPPWLRRVRQVLVLTALVVVPLTMIAARSVPPAATGPSSTQVQPSAKAGATSGAGSQRRATHVFTASPKQIARAEAAYHRALARVEASGAVVAPITSGGGAVTGAALTSERTVAAQAATSNATTTTATAAAALRAASQAQAAQKRTADQAAATQLRSERAASRAETQTQRAAARSGADRGVPDTTTPGAQAAGT